MNYISNTSITSEELACKNAQVTVDGKRMDISKLKCGMLIEGEGEFFQTTNSAIARGVSAKSGSGDRNQIREGRIDAIRGEYAYVDGKRIKLGIGKSISGGKKGGYSGRTFSTLAALKEGDFMNADGKYSLAGCLVADAASVAPETQTDADKKALAYGQRNIQRFYPDWNNPALRMKFFGAPINNTTSVVANAKLQDYVSRVGNSLIPPYAKNKLPWMFIVVDEDGWNATMRAYGLCYVHVDLLGTMDNEAQLAAILGHEIGHALYEHTAQSFDIEKDAQDRLVKREKSVRTLRNLVERFGPTVEVRDTRGHRVFKKGLGTGTADVLIRELPIARDSLLLSKYSIEDELQADRVGLSLMVMAGYDPREAPLVWKELFNNAVYYREYVAERNKADLERKKNERDPLTKQGDVFDIASGYMNNAFRRRVDRISQRGRTTHPDNVRRFATLNQLIGLYYADATTLAQAKTNEKEFAAAVHPYLKGLDEAIAREQTAIQKEKAMRSVLDKQFPAARKKKEQKLAWLTKTPLLLYKGYKLQPIVDARALVGNASCQSPAVESAVDAVDAQYDALREYIKESADKLRSGDAEPHERDQLFAYSYLLARDLNKLLLDMAAAVSLCDRESSLRHAPGGNDLIGIGRRIQYSDEVSEVIEELGKRN